MENSKSYQSITSVFLFKGVFLPRFILVQIALSGALEGTQQLRQWLLTYDVGCELIANMLERWKEWELPPELLPIIE